MKVYRYGLLPPTANALLVREQMQAAHHYRNKLVEIERERRSQLRAATTAVGDVAELEEAVRKADAVVETAAREVKLLRSESRSRSETEPMRQALRDARAAKSAAVAALRDRRRQLREDQTIAAEHDRINDAAAARQRAARAACGVYWGSYLLIEAAAQAARKAPLYDGAEPNDPRFSRWMGEGQLGVQIQNGMDVDEIFSGEDTRIRIDPVVPTAWLKETPRGERRRQSRTKLWLRVGSDGRLPIWAEFPMVMHRPLPPKARIKCATVSLRKHGPREEWSCEITVDDAESPRASVVGQGAVAVDIGWRVIDDELRVAAWKGHDGQQGEIRLSARMLSSLTKAASLRSIRDTNFNTARDALKVWLAEGPPLPDWLLEARAHLHQWRAPGRLAALARRWKTQRFEGDEAGYTALESWRYHDHHLWSWECSQRSKSLRRRREHYRVIASELATRYGVLVLEQFDLRRVARRAPTEQESAENETARSNRQLAAVSELRLALVQAFTGRGGTEWRAPAAHTTVDCAACGTRNEFDAAERLRHQCTHCGAVWDQDENACGNLLLRYAAHQDEEARKEEAPPAPRESRWARAARLRQEKTERKKTRTGPTA